MFQILSRIVLCLAFAISAAGCIQLTGQRIAWHHDADKDTFTAMIFYDGIHDKSDDAREIGNSKQRLREFVDAGDIMLVDWYGEIKVGSIQKMTPEELERDTDAKALRPIVTHIRTQAIGHYSESDQIGAAQHVEIREVSKFLDKLNPLINAGILARGIDRNGRRVEQLRTDELRYAAAKQGHKWITLDGQALVASIPFAPDDWARRKADFFADAFGDMLQTPPQPTQPGEREAWDTARMLTQLTTATPLSVEQRGDMVKLTFGFHDRPNVARATIRSTYNAHHVDTVKQAIPASLHTQIVAALTGEPTSDAIKAVIEFGPPEVTMLALAEAAESGNLNALTLLRERAKAWNTAGRYPQIPNAESDQPANIINSIRDWHRQMKLYPLDKDDLQPAPPLDKRAQPVEPRVPEDEEL